MYKFYITSRRFVDLQRCGDRCLYTVSINSYGRSICDIKNGFLWAKDNFDRCAILLGDSLYRITVQIQSGLDEDSALCQTKKAGQETLEKLLIQLEDRPEIIRCSDLMSQHEFRTALEIIKNLYMSELPFKLSIETDALQFVERQRIKSRLVIDESVAIDLSIKYLIEEVAIYLVLAEQGWLVDVYIGKELPTLSKIIKNEIKISNRYLMERINIYLKLR